MTEEQGIYLTQSDLEIIKEVDTVVSKSLLTGDPHMAMELGRSLRRNMQIAGVALAKLLYELKIRWEQFTSAGIDDEFVNFVHSELGISATTTLKYSRMWEVLFAKNNVPEKYVKDLLNKPIKGLLLLPAAAEDGTLDWETVARATTVGEIRQEVRKARGVQTSANNGIVLTVDVRSGSLYARQGDSSRVAIGFLNLDSTDDVTKRAVERVIRDAGIMEV